MMRAGFEGWGWDWEHTHLSCLEIENHHRTREGRNHFTAFFISGAGGGMFLSGMDATRLQARAVHYA
jgi:hypothetical protein